MRGLEIRRISEEPWVPPQKIDFDLMYFSFVKL